MLTHAKEPAKGQSDTVASAQAAEVRRQAQIAWTLQGRWTPVWHERKGGVVGHDPEAYFRSGAKKEDTRGLSLSSPADASEREADALATRVLAAPAGVVGTARPSAVNSPQVQRQCGPCEDEDKKRDEEMPEGQIQRRGQGPATAASVDRGMAAAVTWLGSGRPLPTGERQFYEERFGYEFSRVRVHADGKAAEAARALNAEAFTLKSDVAFAEGQYQTSSASGRHLLAHELAHVIQQGQAAPLAGALPVQAGGTRIARQEAEAEAEAPAAETVPAAPEPATDAPAPVAAGPTSEPAVETVEQAGGGGLIVDDDTATLTSGQERKSEFLAELKTAVCAAADPILARVGRNTEGCPYIARWLARYSERPASYLERMIRKFAPGATSASSARDYIPLVAARVASGVETWIDTGEVPADIPDELRAELPGGGGIAGAIGRAISSAVSAVGSALSAIGGLFFKAGPGGARAGADRTALASRLGAGQPLAGAARTRMEVAFGRSFGDVRVHDDAGAAGLAHDLGAHAFTLGEHVAFASGRYQPGTPVGDAILAHELAHVVQQGGGGPGPLAGAETPPDHAVEADADRAAAGAVASIYVPTQAPSDWHPRVRGGLRLSRCAGPTSSAKVAQGAARLPGAATPEAEAAPPAKDVADPKAQELSSALSTASRQRIRESRAVTTVPIDELFSTSTAKTTIPLPTNTEARFASDIPEKLRDGLSNVAGQLVRTGLNGSAAPLQADTTLTVVLDLTKYGGDKSAYRFTRASAAPHQTGTILIERLGTARVEHLSSAEQAQSQQRFERLGFKRGRGWSDSDFESVLSAISALPDSMLAPVAGLRFERGSQSRTDPAAGGDYDPKNHVITMYDSEFSTEAAASSVRYGAPGVGAGLVKDSTRAVTHEIGHALDLRPLREVMLNLEKTENGLKAFSEFEQPPGSGKYAFPRSTQKEFDRVVAAIDEAEKQEGKARSLSGSEWKATTGRDKEIVIPLKAKDNGFREAVKADGKTRITDYAEKDWQEAFAEGFSFYILDPAGLERLRPHTFAYFARTFPAPAAGSSTGGP